MAGEFRISIALGHMIPEGAALSAATFPTLAYAVRRITEQAHQQWTEYASGAPLPNGQVINSRTGEYTRSIQVRDTGDFSGEVYSDLAYAQSIEEGAPARDLKQILSSSAKVRLTHDGRRYLIIPFRWNHPNSVMGNSMPEAVQTWWQGKTPSSISGTYRRVSGTGAVDIKTRQALTVPGWRYKWGSRLTDADLEGLGVQGSAAKRMSGMVNFRNPGSSGGGSHSKYITFRTMVEGSKGWVTKAVDGKWPARTVAETLQPIAEEAFKLAMQEDIERILGGA
jgi:hypothetical protein